MSRLDSRTNLTANKVCRTGEQGETERFGQDMGLQQKQMS